MADTISIGDATFGDAILDRLMHDTLRITLERATLRRLQPATAPTTPLND